MGKTSSGTIRRQCPHVSKGDGDGLMVVTETVFLGGFPRKISAWFGLLSYKDPREFLAQWRLDVMLCLYAHPHQKQRISNSESPF